MTRFSKGRLSGCIAVFASAATSSFALAQDVPTMEPPVNTGPVGVLERPRASYDALGFRSGNFIFYPSLTVSTTYDDNIFATRLNKVHDLISHLKPVLTASGNFGSTAVSGYINADGRLYASRSALNSISPGVGFGFKSEIQRGLNVTGRADYGYKIEDPGDTARLGGVGVVNKLVFYHDFNSSLSATKDFGPFSLSAGTTYQHLAYLNTTDANGNLIRQNLRDADIASWALRAGYIVGPGLKAFAEPSVNIKRYAASAFNSNGYRIIGGFSTELTRLVSGEVYVGYTSQTYDRVFGTVSGFTAGGNVRWFPTELLTVTLKADRTIQDSGVSLGVGGGSPYFVTSIGVNADYELLRNLIVSGRADYQKMDYQRNSTRRDNTYGLGTTVSYLFNRYLSGSLDYKYTTLRSNIGTQSYDRNQFTASLKGQF